MKRVIIFLALWLFSSQAFSFETAARNAYVIDVSTGAVMLDKDSAVAMPPASMSKLMTIALTFKALKSGAITLDTKFPVSEKAWKMGGSRMFVDVNTQVKVSDLLQGVIVQSGNDACVVLAEGLAGSEGKFAEMMDAYAKELGLQNSSFANSSGWPHPDQRMSAADLAKLAYYIETQYSEYFHYFSQPEFTYNDITQANRNPLLGVMEGADGFKTGHTQEAGFGLVGSVSRGERRVIFVLMGLSSEAERATEAERIATWALSGFVSKTHRKAGEEVVKARTWLGDKSEIALTTDRDFTTLMPITSADKEKLTVSFKEPIAAPLPVGTQVGMIKIEAPDMPAYELPLVTAEELGRGGFFSRYKDVLENTVNLLLAKIQGRA